MNLWFTSQPKVFLLSFPVFCGYKVSWSGMCLIFSVYPQANPGVLGPPSTALCGGTCESSAFCPWTEKQNFPGFLNHQMMGKTCISQDFTGSPLWVWWVFAAAPARTDLRTNHCLSAWQDHPLKNSSDQKKQVYCFLILNQITYRFACLETKLGWFQTQHFNKNVCWFLLWKNFLYKKQAALLFGSKQGKCLQIAHMQFWFGQDILIPPIKQLQNPFFFHCSLLKAIEWSQQNPDW